MLVLANMPYRICVYRFGQPPSDYYDMLASQSFSFTPAVQIAESLRRFGITDETSLLLVGKFDATKTQVGVLARRASTVTASDVGTGSEMTDQQDVITDESEF